MSTLADLRPGDVFLGPIGGGAGKLIGAGQLLVAPWKHQLTWRTWWKIRHCGIVTFEALRDDQGQTLHGPIIAEAEPGGMRERKIGAEHWTGEYVYIRPNYPGGQAQAQRVADLAGAMTVMKVPYAFEDYAAIFAHRLHLPIPHLDGFIAATGPDGLPKRAICSQAVDAVLTLSGGLTGGHVFDDGRLPQDIVPSELYLRLIELVPELVIRPGMPDLHPWHRPDVGRPSRADLL